MKKISVLSFTLLALSINAIAQTQEHRLAFSQAQQVEVFVDQTGESDWCKEELALRFAFDLDQANITAIESLLPKLGVLFSQQCPAAKKVTWQALNKSKAVQATGTASKQTAWLMNQDQAVSTQQVAVAPVSTEEPKAEALVAQSAVQSTPAIVASTETVVSPDSPVATVTTEAPVAEPVAQPEPVVAESIETTTALEEAVATSVAVVPVVEPVAQAEPVVIVSTVVAAPAAPAAAETQAVAPVPVPVAAVKPEPVKGFSVNGWEPKSPSDFLETHKTLRVLLDQQGCKTFVRSDADLGQQEYVVKSNGANCENGFLNGEGNLTITRSDGAMIVGFDAFFKHGLPLSTNMPFPIVDMDEGGNAYVLLEKDIANQFYYLLKVDKSWDGRWRLDAGTVYLLTEAKDTFRQAEPIKSAVLAPVSVLTKSFNRIDRYSLLAVTDFTTGITQRKGESWLYQVSVSKPWRSNEWKFDPNNATNYLFRNEAREAREAQQRAEREAYQARLELEKLARQAARELESYKTYHEQQRNLSDLVQSKLTNVNYSKTGYSRYQSLLKGNEANFSQIINVTGEKKSLFWADYPYQLAIDTLDTDVELGKGWYLISGKQKLDLEQKDDQDLPLTVVYPTFTFACEEKGCTDFFTPLNLTRLEFNKSSWTPEAAEQQIADAQKVQK